MTATEGAGLQHEHSLFVEGKQALCVTVPGSCANLGPGFDTLALAIDLRCTIKLRIASAGDKDALKITLEGAGTEGISDLDDNLVLKTITRFWPLAASLLPHLRLTISSQIPPGRGLGSSAAATVAALYAVAVLSSPPLDHKLLLKRAQELEGHADNACASLFGGLVAACWDMSERELLARKLAWPEQWQLIVTVPAYALSTIKARSVLPERVPMSDAVANLQRLSLLLCAAATADDATLCQALADRLHEPYREALVPELKQVRQALGDLPALGTVLSGAGSSVLTIVNRRHGDQVLERLNSWAKKQEQPPRIMPLQVAEKGAACVFQ